MQQQPFQKNWTVNLAFSTTSFLMFCLTLFLTSHLGYLSSDFYRALSGNGSLTLPFVNGWNFQFAMQVGAGLRYEVATIDS